MSTHQSLIPQRLHTVAVLQKPTPEQTVRLGDAVMQAAEMTRAAAFVAITAAGIAALGGAAPLICLGVMASSVAVACGGFMAAGRMHKAIDYNAARLQVPTDSIRASIALSRVTNRLLDSVKNLEVSFARSALPPAMVPVMLPQKRLQKVMPRV